jgi:hypothetical protein
LYLATLPARESRGGRETAKEEQRGGAGRELAAGSGRDWEHSAWFQEWENIAYARLGEEAQLPCS